MTHSKECTSRRKRCKLIVQNLHFCLREPSLESYTHTLYNLCDSYTCYWSDEFSISVYTRNSRKGKLTLAFIQIYCFILYKFDSIRGTLPLLKPKCNNTKSDLRKLFFQCGQLENGYENPCILFMVLW